MFSYSCGPELVEYYFKFIIYFHFRCTEALLLHSGYHSVPQRRMLWQQKADCYNHLIASNIRRREVDAVLSCLHFRDNSKIEKDGYYKVRPIFHNLNRMSKQLVSLSKDGKFSVDECMVPYYGRHSSKQYIRGKPIRYGYKVWSLCTSDGSGVWFEPYCGRDTRIEDQALGQGPNVVLDLIEKGQLIPGSEVYFDNLFTSFPLLEKMSEKGIGGTGTIRQNRLHRIDIISKKDLEKKTVERGHSVRLYRGDQVLVAWKDNKGVYAASNKHSGYCSKACKRFCRTTRKDIPVPIPDLIGAYNNGMGGVDLLDAMVAVYRVLYRIHKWWFAIYTWSLSVSAVNAWRLRMHITGNKEPFMDFLRELVIEIFVVHGKPPSISRRPSLAPPDGRFDGVNHWIVSTGPSNEQNGEGDGERPQAKRRSSKNGEGDGEKPKPKRRNCKQCTLDGSKDNKTVYMCEKCKVPLHTYCFKRYHVM